MKLSLLLLITIYGFCCVTSPSGTVSSTVQTLHHKTFEEKLADLKACGLELAPPFTIQDLLNSWDRSEYEKELAFQDDWADPKIFDKFVELLADADPSKVYISLDDGGQDCNIACVTKNNFECLRNRGLNFKLLSSSNFR